MIGPDDWEQGLATYGTLAPGRPNAHLLNGIDGTWRQGKVRGHLIEEGWDAAIGYPAIVLDEAAPQVVVHLFTSADLPVHRPRLDAFEGKGYRRVPVAVTTGDGVTWAGIYVSANNGSDQGDACHAVGGRV
ncbi:gamma-glutamylcyclotransferase (GGCT)/AIG2-like uncharacterized protein YtfP [Sphingomonas trueperi]|uniref:gamma-glutamylcyclotransferase family protein n=1 Tax=Sphingomonas trueperi TaxID=53317 RepID=UPI0033987DBA